MFSLDPIFQSIVPLIFFSSGRNASRLVQCFGNAPDEMLISPSNAFSLAANGLHEVHLRVCPVRSGFRTYNVNAVDVENHQIVDTWMVKVDTRMPVISKQFGKTTTTMTKYSER